MLFHFLQSTCKLILKPFELITQLISNLYEEFICKYIEKYVYNNNKNISNNKKFSKDPAQKMVKIIGLNRLKPWEKIVQGILNKSFSSFDRVIFSIGFVRDSLDHLGVDQIIQCLNVFTIRFFPRSIVDYRPRK